MIYLNNDSFLCDKAISLPRGVFFPCLPPWAEGCFQREAVLMEWPEIRLGTREEALVNTHEQSLSLAVSAEEVTIKRGDEAVSLPYRERERERETVLSSSFFSFLKRLLLRVEPQNTVF